MMWQQNALKQDRSMLFKFWCVPLIGLCVLRASAAGQQGPARASVQEWRKSNCTECAAVFCDSMQGLPQEQGRLLHRIRRHPAG